MATVFDKVSPHFSGLEENYFNEFFQPSSDLVASQIGDLYRQNRYFGAPTLSHQQLAFWAGQYAMYSVSNTSYRFWADSDSYNDDLPWKLALWRLMHVLPLGHAFSDYAFRINDLLSWNPLQKPAGRGMEVKGSNRPLYGNCISQGLFHKLFPEYFDEPSAMFLNALLDAFSPAPNRDNPFYIAIRNALRVTIIKSPYPIPFFWHKFIVQFLSKSEIDLANYIASTTVTNEPSLFSIKQIDEMNAANIEPQLPSVPIPEPVENKTEQSNNSFTSQIENVKNSDSITVPAAENLVMETNFSEIESPDYGHITKLLHEIGLLVCEKVESGSFPVNAPSAFGHKIDDRFFISYPAGINKIQSLLNDRVDVDTLDTFLRSLTIIIVRDAMLTRPSGNVVDIKLAELHRQFVPAFFPDHESLPNNPNIRIVELESASL